VLTSQINSLRTGGAKLAWNTSKSFSQPAGVYGPYELRVY